MIYSNNTCVCCGRLLTTSEDIAGTRCTKCRREQDREEIEIFLASPLVGFDRPARRVAQKASVYRVGMNRNPMKRQSAGLAPADSRE